MEFGRSKFKLILFFKRVSYKSGTLEQGYGTVLVKTIQKISFELLKLHRIYALVDPRNIGSMRVLIQSNMVEEGLLREHRFQKGK